MQLLCLTVSNLSLKDIPDNQTLQFEHTEILELHNFSHSPQSFIVESEQLNWNKATVLCWIQLQFMRSCTFHVIIKDTLVAINGEYRYIK